MTALEVEEGLVPPAWTSGKAALEGLVVGRQAEREVVVVHYSEGEVCAEAVVGQPAVEGQLTVEGQQVVEEQQVLKEQQDAVSQAVKVQAVQALENEVAREDEIDEKIHVMKGAQGPREKLGRDHCYSRYGRVWQVEAVVWSFSAGSVAPLVAGARSL